MVFSDAASSLKDSWQILVNQNEMLKHVGVKLNVDKFAFLDYENTLAASGGVAYADAYEAARDKVCEVQAWRALASKEKQNAPRATLVAKAQSIIKQLGGKLPPPVNLMLQRCSKPST